MDFNQRIGVHLSPNDSFFFKKGGWGGILKFCTHAATTIAAALFKVVYHVEEMSIHDNLWG